MDEGYGACYFRQAVFAESLARALLHFQDQRYFVSCWAIMPNHCHLVIQPWHDYRLEIILKGIKGTVAREVNAALDGVGPLWQDESYDRIVRDEEHLWRVVQYIGRNPQRAGLPREQWYRWIHPDWESLGWKFLEECEPEVERT